MLATIYLTPTVPHTLCRQRGTLNSSLPKMLATLQGIFCAQSLKQKKKKHKTMNRAFVSTLPFFWVGDGVLDECRLARLTKLIYRFLYGNLGKC